MFRPFSSRFPKHLRYQGLIFQNDIMTTDTPQANVDVVIVGAGPVGLFQALGLLQKGITNIRILEKHNELNKLEKSIGINTRVLETFELTTVVGKRTFS